MWTAYSKYHSSLHHQGDALTMEAVSTSETLVNVYQTTRRNNPEDSHLTVNHVRFLQKKKKKSEGAVP
jgi:hypothetical protein